MRDAVFFLMMLVFTALSIALYAFESISCAAFLFFAETRVFTSFTTSFIALVRRALKTFLRSELRMLRFADLVIGIFTTLYGISKKMQGVWVLLIVSRQMPPFPHQFNIPYSTFNIRSPHGTVYP